MSKVFAFLADGLEEVECLAVVDVLRRAGAEVTLVSVTGSREITGSHHIHFQADALFDETAAEEADVLFLPGGMPGTNTLKAHEGLKNAICKANKQGRRIAAICAAPSILGEMGLLKGNQTQLGFLYPKTTDFIFAVIGEEMGFIIAATVIITYVILITRAIYIAKTAKDSLGAYISMGIAGIFIFHMTENIGMAMGLLPITGVPLPFVSYGGSSLLTNLILIGLLLNISGRRQKVLFIE